MEYVFEYALPVALFMVAAYVIKALLDAKTRHKLIDKGMVDEKIKLLFPKPPETHSASLKWGSELPSWWGNFFLSTYPRVSQSARRS